MADPGEIFFKTLSRFKHLRLYANAINDITVPYCTSAIEIEDIFAGYIRNGIKIEMKEDYEYVIEKFVLPAIPPPGPTLFSREWFDSIKPLPLLPPVAQFRFPFNFMIYGILPFLAIPVLSYVLYRFSADSKASKERIKQFESQDSYQQKLATVFQKLEREFESAAVRTVDSPEGESYPIIKSNLHPVVTPTQKRMVEWLNQLPFQKHLAFFPGVRNSHGMIICRDSHRFDQHKRGESVVRHWADHFVF